MAEVLTYGLKSIKVAEPETSGAMPTVLTELCRTYQDSMEFVEDEATVTEEFCDQDDDPIAVFAVKGGKSVKFSTFDYSPEVLQKVKGGTVVDDTWAEPVVMPEIHQAVEIETRTGLKFQFPKARVTARFNAQVRKNGVMLLEVMLRPLSPAAGIGAVKIVKPA